MKNIPIFLLLLLTATICHAQHKRENDKNATPPNVIATVDVINRTNDISKTSFKKEKWYVVKFINLNPLLFDLKVSSENRVDPVSKDDNILQSLYNSINQSAGAAVSSPGTPATKEAIAGTKEMAGKKALVIEKATKDAKAEAFLTAYDAYTQSVTAFKKIQLHIQELALFCNVVTGYCYDPLLERTAIVNNMEADSEISDYITSLGGAVPNEAILIRKAGSLTTGLNNAFDACVTKQAALKQAYEQLKAGAENMPTEAVNSMESVNQSLADVKAAYDKFKPADLTTLASKTGEAYTIVHNAGSFDRQARIYAGDVDSVITTMEIVALDKNTAVPGISPVKLDMNVTGGFRTFTSIGLMVNFFNVRDDKYYIDADSTVRRADRRNKAFPSLAMLQSFYFKNGKSAVIGGTVGLSANLNSLNSLTDLRIFLGPSYIIGNKVKFVLSAGITGGYSEELKGDFEKDKKVSALMLNQEQNKLTDKYFRFGAYVGLAIKIL